MLLRQHVNLSKAPEKPGIVSLSDSIMCSITSQMLQLQGRAHPGKALAAVCGLTPVQPGVPEAQVALEPAGGPLEHKVDASGDGRLQAGICLLRGCSRLP